jgi:hypothetical protein
MVIEVNKKSYKEFEREGREREGVRWRKGREERFMVPWFAKWLRWFTQLASTTRLSMGGWAPSVRG